MPRTAFLLALCVLVVALREGCGAKRVIELSNERVRFVFARSASGAPYISEIYANGELPGASKKTWNQVLDNSGAKEALWRATFVTRSEQHPADANTPADYDIHEERDGKGARVVLSWSGIRVPGHVRLGGKVSVSLEFSLQPNANTADAHVMYSTTDRTISLWSLSVVAPGVATGSDERAAILHPKGFGTAVVPSSITSQSTLRYPCPANMQWLASILGAGASQVALSLQRSPAEPNQRGYAGLYFAAHDGEAHTKDFWYEPAGEAGSGATAVNFGITLYPENMGKWLRSWSPPFSFRLGTHGGRIIDIAEEYRVWALENAVWVKKGPLSRRIAKGDPQVPSWYLENSLWLNTGWQNLDIFNQTQGDPPVVHERSIAMRKRFGVPFLLHWYVWDRDIVFDQGYPDYFPAKANFSTVVAALAQAGVRTFPYINGRLFDIHVPEWRGDDAAQSAVLSADEQKLSPSSSLHTESYGSGASFAVMCPATAFWDREIGAIVGALKHNFSVSGVYIDQIGAASAKLCFATNHGHPTGGGTYWVNGYRSLLAATQSDSGGMPLITESNAEPFMDAVVGYLTLVAFGDRMSSAVTAEASSFIAPVFPAVYGGYYISAGREFFASDFADNRASVAAAKAGEMFVLGAQLGWFSLGGTQDPPAMGLFEILMSSESDEFVAFVRAASELRRVMIPFVGMGRLASLPTVSCSHNCGEVVSSAWKALEGGNVCEIGVLLSSTSSSGAPAQTTLAVELETAGLPHSCGSAVKVERVYENGRRESVPFSASASLSWSVGTSAAYTAAAFVVSFAS